MANFPPQNPTGKPNNLKQLKDLLKNKSGFAEWFFGQVVLANEGNLKAIATVEWYFAAIEP